MVPKLIITYLLEKSQKCGMGDSICRLNLSTSSCPHPMLRHLSWLVASKGVYLSLFQYLYLLFCQPRVSFPLSTGEIKVMWSTLPSDAAFPWKSALPTCSKPSYAILYILYSLGEVPYCSHHIFLISWAPLPISFPTRHQAPREPKLYHSFLDLSLKCGVCTL